MARQPRLRPFTILLLKEEIASHNEALRDDQEFEELRVSGGRTLVLKPRRTNPPWWTDFLRPHVGESNKLDGLVNSSTSAVLFLRAGGRLFAFTFGHGRNLLEATAFERDFGLKVVLNTVAPDQLKSVDARTFDDLTVHTRRDVSQGSPIEAFGLDVSRDLVRAVTGRPRDDSLARRLTGSDALALSSRAQVPELPQLCERLLEAYGSDQYVERFSWVDQLRPVKDPTEVARLNQALVAAIQKRALTDIHLAPPEPLDWARIEGFRFSTEPDDSELHADPPISAYLESIDEPEKITRDRLKHDRVYAVGSDQGQIFENWPVYRCIVFEATLENRLYALSAGDWYSIEKSFEDEVLKFARDLPELDIALPDAAKGTNEADYNKQAATHVDALCMDTELIRVARRDPIELCDLLSRSKQFIHVKKRGSSSTLSHLFLQGLVSGEMIFRDGGFRQASREHVDRLDSAFTDSVPSDRPASQECEISYVVITRSDRKTPLTLPFFSLVSLRTAVQQLQDWGYKVSVRAVRER